MKALSTLMGSYNSLGKKFNQRIEEFKVIDVDKTKKNELIKYLAEFRMFFNDLSELNYKFFQESLQKEYKPEKIDMCKKYIDASQTNIQRCQNQVIFPITLRLSEITSEESKNRGRRYFRHSLYASVVIAGIFFVIGYIISSSSQMELKNFINEKIDDCQNSEIDIMETNFSSISSEIKTIQNKIDTLSTVREKIDGRAIKDIEK